MEYRPARAASTLHWSASFRLVWQGIWLAVLISVVLRILHVPPGIAILLGFVLAAGWQYRRVSAAHARAAARKLIVDAAEIVIHEPDRPPHVIRRDDVVRITRDIGGSIKLFGPGREPVLFFAPAAFERYDELVEELSRWMSIEDVRPLRPWMPSRFVWGGVAAGVLALALTRERHLIVRLGGLRRAGVDPRGGG